MRRHETPAEFEARRTRNQILSLRINIYQCAALGDRRPMGVLKKRLEELKG